MALEGQKSVVVGHAAAVVAHFDQRLTAVFKDDVDRGRARVDGVLHQLLDHRGRALDHFAGGDLVDQVGGKDVDVGH